MSKLKPGKVAIIGCGFVGSASAFALMQSGLFTEMVLLDANHQKAEGEAEFRLEDRCRFMPEIMMILRMQPLL